MKLRIALLISIFLVIPITTWAGHYEETCASWNNGRCERYDRKYIGGDESSSGPVVKYGAIAYGKANRSYGASHNWNNRSIAQSKALQTCGKLSNDCEIIVWFSDGSQTFLLWAGMAGGGFTQLG